MVQHVERSRPPGRNDPCPCGSGKKYKRCCLLRDSPTVAVRQLRDVLAELSGVDALGDRLAAIQVLEDARSGLHDPELDTMLVERYLQLDPADAEAGLRRWWEAERDRYSGAGLAQVLIDQERADEALDVLLESQGAGAPPEYWRLVATLHEARGETEAAVAAMELYTRLAAESADAWLTLADMHLRLAQHDRALIALRHAGDLRPDQALPRVQRLRILAADGRWREARDLAEALLEGRYEDTTPELLYELRDLLARSHFVLGYFEAARRLWESLLEEHPTDVEVRYQLASLDHIEQRHHHALLALGGCPDAELEWPQRLRILDLRLHSLLALHEYDEAADVALQIETIDPALRVTPLVTASRAITGREYAWALEQLEGEAPERYRNLWYQLRLDCLAQLGRWQEVIPALRGVSQAAERLFIDTALLAMAAGKIDLAERLLEKIDDQQSPEVRALTALIGPLRQSRRAAEVRRQQQVDQAEKQRWSTENRELRRQIRDLEQHNAALADALAISESTLERVLERVGVTADDSGKNWEAHMQGMAERAHKHALEQELQGAERRLRTMLGQTLWEGFSESVRASLREGEWLYAAVEGEDRDYGAALLEFARGLERAYKDAIFVPARASWQRRPGAADRLQDEGHDPSLGPFVRWVLQGSHLTLGSMAAALDRMSDIRRQGVAINLLRRHLRIDPYDERTLADWKRIADRLAMAADARNQPAHAATVSRESVREFRELVLGTNGLLRALA